MEIIEILKRIGIIEILKWIGIAVLAVLYFFDWWEYYQDMVKDNCPTDKYGYTACVIVSMLRMANHWAVPAIAIGCIIDKG